MLIQIMGPNDYTAYLYVIHTCENGHTCDGCTQEQMDWRVTGSLCLSSSPSGEEVLTVLSAGMGEHWSQESPSPVVCQDCLTPS